MFTTVLAESEAVQHVHAESLFETVAESTCSALMHMLRDRARSSVQSSSSQFAKFRFFVFVCAAAAALDETAENFIAEAINNYALCSLNVRRVQDAIDSLESLVQRDPARFLCDPIAFNLCTMYDLTNSPDGSTMKKKVLQQIAAAYHVDDPLLHWRCFRLN